MPHITFVPFTGFRVREDGQLGPPCGRGDAERDPLRAAGHEPAGERAAEPRHRLRRPREYPAGPWRGGVTQMLFADGAVDMLSPEIDPDVLKALATPDGGENIPADSF